MLTGQLLALAKARATGVLAPVRAAWRRPPRVSHPSHGMRFVGWTTAPGGDRSPGSDLHLKNWPPYLDDPCFSGGQGVAGSNPVVPTADRAVPHATGYRPWSS